MKRTKLYHSVKVWRIPWPTASESVKTSVPTPCTQEEDKVQESVNGSSCVGPSHLL